MISSLFLLILLQAPEEMLLLSGSIKATNPQQLTVPHSNNWQMKLKWLSPEGKIVKKGDPVVRFDPASLVNEIKQLEIRLVEILEQEKQEKARQRLNEEQAEFNLLSAETDYKKAEIDLAVPEKWVSPYQRDQEKLTAEKTKRTLIEARKKLENTKNTRKDMLAKLNLDKAFAEHTLERKKGSLEKLTLTAQFDGPVIHRLNPYNGSKISEGDVVRSSMVIAEIPSDDGLHIVAWASEVDVHRLVVGQQATLFFDAMKDCVLTGHISSIASSVEKKWLWGDGAYFQVIIEPDKTLDSSFVTGMSVQAKVAIQQNLTGIKIPLEKIINRGSFVLIDDDTNTHYKLIGYDLLYAYLEKFDETGVPHE